jgi:hypothetical protein
MKEETSPITAPHIHEPSERLKPTAGLLGYFRGYARERPGVVALWCLGIGLVLGWKLKMW